MFIQLILQIILIILNAVFASAEIAVISVSPSKIDKLADEGNKKALRLQKLMSKPAHYLAAIQVAITFSGFTASAFMADSFADEIIRFTNNAGLENYEIIFKPLSIIAVTLILSCIMIIFGELVPKRVAMKNPEKIALSLIGIIRFIKILFAPLVWLLNFLSNLVLKIMGINPENNDETVTEEEIIMMSDAGAEKGTIDESENRIIKNIFAFDDMTAEQICTHRTDVSILWSEESVETWEETIHRTRHSSFPICGENVDDVIGILNAKDYFRLDDKSRENIIENAVREPYFVHENMKADSLFAQMKKNGGHHFAVVVDEYGGMTGIITVTDLVEQLVGDFDDDELDEHEVEFEKIGENQWLISGITDLSKICEEISVNLPTDKYDTLGGYIIASLGEIPKDGTSAELECDGLHIDILEINHHRIELCKVTKI